MISTTIRTGLVRQLSETSAERPVVLSLYLDLDPAEFATQPARSTAVRSLLDQASKEIENAELEQDDVKALRAALERAESFFEEELPTEGVHSVAVFVCEPLELFESIALPRSLPTRIAISKTPLVGPLAVAAHEGSWGVVLVNREVGRLLTGNGARLQEVDDGRGGVQGRLEQDGRSESRYERTIENEMEDRMRRVAELVVQELDRRPVDHLLLGGPHDLLANFRKHLREDIAERVSGELDGVDVATASPDDVLDAMRPALDVHQERREREAFERLGAPLTASGTADVLPALYERRVETLLIDEARSEPGTVCPACGWVGQAGAEECPADSTPVDAVDDLTEPAVELAIQQDAQVLPVRVQPDELRAAGGMAALLRF